MNNQSLEIQEYLYIFDYDSKVKHSTFKLRVHNNLTKNKKGHKYEDYQYPV